MNDHTDSSLNINIQNLSEEERNQLLALIQKANTPEQKDVPAIERAKDNGTYYSISMNNGVGVAQYDEEDNHPLDNNRYNSYNYFTDKSLADKVANYINTNLLFIRKAIEFADGYEWEDDECNYFVKFNSDAGEYTVDYCCNYKQNTTVYMSEENVERFAEWCNKYKDLLK